MKLEIGKEYVTRSGLKVKIYDISEEVKYPIKAGVIQSDNSISLAAFSNNGEYFSYKTDDWDIIGEWQEPLDFDWSCLPAWCNNYIAMDKDRRWFSYSETPKNGIEEAWYKLGGEALLIPKDHAPKNFKGTWENSLFKNPNIK